MLRISQIKDRHCFSLDLDANGVEWLCEAFYRFQSQSSWTITRYENSRKLSLSLETNRFGAFFRLVIFDNRGRNTIITMIIPEGRNGWGFELFSSTLQSQVDLLQKVEKEVLETVLIDHGVACADSLFEDSGTISLGSISSRLFEQDLLLYNNSVPNSEKMHNDIELFICQDHSIEESGRNIMGGIIAEDVGEMFEETSLAGGKAEESVCNEKTVIDVTDILETTLFRVSFSPHSKPLLADGLVVSESNASGGKDLEVTPLQRVLSDRELLDRVTDTEWDSASSRLLPR
ncbi:unnamed protein product [Cuscuta europaea]|uniref:Uncharacterized protein n=1 Tax=Cuscuta europaea TaxID=41803 RepID=A0A9P1ECP4_CUSEU|nr:unnamed protein product [Cuscuta europaea]